MDLYLAWMLTRGYQPDFPTERRRRPSGGPRSAPKTTRRARRPMWRPVTARLAARRA